MYTYFKRKLRTCTIKIQPEKNKISCTKLDLCFNFSPNAQGPLKMFDVQFSEIFKKNPKMACVGPVRYEKEQSQEFW